MDLENNSKALYKSSEVAKMLGISSATLKKLSLKNEIKFITINKHRYYVKEDIVSFLENHKSIEDDTK